jgi:hypothetical protein
MIKFTVVLLYPDFLITDAPYGQEIYVAFVDADDCISALKLAQLQAFSHLREDEAFQGWPDATPDCFALSVMFKGHRHPCMFGWQC